MLNFSQLVCVFVQYVLGYTVICKLYAIKCSVRFLKTAKNCTLKPGPIGLEQVYMRMIR